MLIAHKTKPLNLKKLSKVPVRVKWGGLETKLAEDRKGKGGWKGVRHSDMLECLRAEVHKLTGLTGHLDHNWTSHNGGNVAACFRAEALPPFGSKWVGVTASNLRHARLTVYCGYAAEDGTRLISGTVTASPYNKNFDLKAECKALAAAWVGGVAKCQSDEHDLKWLRLTPSESDRLILETGRLDLLPWKFAGKFDAAYRDHDDLTAWGLLRAYSLVVSACPPVTQMGKLFEFRNLLAKKVALLKGAA